MPILSKKYLNELVQQRVINESFRINDSNRIDDDSKRYQIFFSYSYPDKDYAIKIVNLLEKCGFSVYIDLRDPKLTRSKETNKQTIERITKVMNRCRCLIYMHTSSAKTSRWCPWELGYMSGKTRFRCATILLVEDKEDFPRQEYLEIYPYLDYDSYKNTNNYTFWVNDLNDRNIYVPLKEFIENGKDPYDHRGGK